MSGFQPYDPFDALLRDESEAPDARPATAPRAGGESGPGGAAAEIDRSAREGTAGGPGLKGPDEAGAGEAANGSGPAPETLPDSIPALLDLLATSSSRSVRRRAFDRLLEGPVREVGRAAADRLNQADQPWFVVRNLLALMGALPEWPWGWSPSGFAGHEHPAIRLEALKLLVRVPRRREWAMCRLLEEEDTKAVALGLAAAQENPPPDALPLLMTLAEEESLAIDLRRMAVRALGAIEDPVALDTLLGLVLETPNWYSRLIGRPRLAPRSELLLEALAALHRGWEDDPTARQVLRRAAVDLDGRVRRAAAGRLD